MSVIYRPCGMAREYSPYALNIYIGCSHRCKYCYAPHTLQKSSESYFGKPEPRKDILKSFEPTIEPEESLKLIRKTLEQDSVDHYKIGKINNYKAADKWQDWEKYLGDCVELLRPTNKQVYYKFCLRKLAPNIPLTDAEKNPDEYIVRIKGNKQMSLWGEV